MRRWEMTGVGRDAPTPTDAAVPEPGPKQVVVEVAAVSLNGRDRMVIETGRDVSRYRLGDRVVSTFTPDWRDGRPVGDARTPSCRTLGGFHPGVLAEYVCLSEEWLVTAPATLSPAEASTLPYLDRGPFGKVVIDV